MIFKVDVLKKIKSGSIGTAFRRWKKPTVKAGGSLLTAVGNLRIDEVRVISEKDISESEAQDAGFPDKASLLKKLNYNLESDLYRISFHYEGEDPRKKLRMQDDLDPAEITAILKKLQGLDKRSVYGLWTKEVLNMIASYPAMRAADLASKLGFEKNWLKTNIRKLKSLGLTESLEVGYKISPRGKKILSKMV